MLGRWDAGTLEAFWGLMCGGLCARWLLWSLLTVVASYYITRVSTSALSVYLVVSSSYGLSAACLCMKTTLLLRGVIHLPSGTVR